MNVVQKVREGADHFVNLPAVLEGERTWTFSEFYGRIDRLSAAFHDSGLRKGDVLLCWLPNMREALECELACLQSGVIWVTLNAGLTWPEVALVIDSTDPVAIVTTPELAERMVPQSKSTEEKLSAARTILVGATDHSGRAEALDYETLMAADLSAPPAVTVDESDKARLRYTSGTTGRAKAAVLSHRAYLASLCNLQEQLHPLTTDDRVLHAAPLTHASAALTYPILAAGGANVILPSFDAETVLETIERERITTLFAVPTMLQRLAASPSFESRDLSSIRTISYGGAPMPDGKLEPLLRKLGPVFMQIYGLTEALHPVTCLQRDEHWLGNPRLGSVGRCTSICEVRITDDAGQVVPENEVGEFCVRGPIAFDGYWRDPEATAEVLVDGWVHTGDLGYRDHEGFHWIVDRKKDVIISGGLNVYTKEVEARLSAHPDVEEAALIGLPHEDWGEVVHAAVHLRAGAECGEDALIAHCREALAAYKTPKGVTFFDEPLPKNSAGKISKPDLRRLVRSDSMAKG